MTDNAVLQFMRLLARHGDEVMLIGRVELGAFCWSLRLRTNDRLRVVGVDCSVLDREQEFHRAFADLDEANIIEMAHRLLTERYA